MTRAPGLLSVLTATATRRALADYLRFTALVLFILLTIAYTIDLAATFPQIRRAAATRETSLPVLLAPYLLQRGADIVTRMLPVAMFFGPFLAEIARRQRLETVILSAAGATPPRLYAGVLWLALLAGGAHMALETHLRPAAIWAQVDSGLGDYAKRFRQSWKYGVWFVTGDTAIRADVLRSAAPEMHNVLIFDGIRAAGLETITGAGRAAPAGTPYLWTLSDVTRWETVFGDAARVGRAPVAERELELIPEQLQYNGVAPFYLPQPALNRLAGLRAPPDGLRPAVATAQWRRWTAWLLPGIVALLGVSMANLGFDGRRMLIARLIGLAALGYVYVVTVRTFWTIGELGALAAPLAVGAPLALGLGAAVLFIRRGG